MVDLFVFIQFPAPLGAPGHGNTTFSLKFKVQLIFLTGGHTPVGELVIANIIVVKTKNFIFFAEQAIVREESKLIAPALLFIGSYYFIQCVE